MREVEVALGSRSYPILIEDGLLGRAGPLLLPYARSGKLVVVTDAQVWSALGKKFATALSQAGISADTIILPAGEATKSWDSLRDVVEGLLARGLERGDKVVAFGGGVIGDLAGFAASVMKRGCGFVQVPTTLLAQVDSSVGGKTAINAAAGKNLVGTFHQPSLVLIDPASLLTLPRREVLAGYAEVVKYGLIDDADFFAWCEANGPALIDGDVNARLHAIEVSVRAKAAIVAEDEREKGRRALLNLGHTFGHALEAETGFSDRMLHGEAVAIGMALAFRFSASLGLCALEDAARVARHLDAVGLPSSIPADLDTDADRMVAHMVQDKKSEGGKPVLILARGIGQAHVEHGLAWDQVAAFLSKELAKR